MKYTYTIEHRSAFRERLLSMPVDERAVADATERVGRAIFEPLIGPQHGHGGLEAAVWKAAGYNAGLHGWTRLALRAAAAADAWIDACGPVDLDLGDLTLFEYFLAERAGARGLKPGVPGNWAELVERLAAGYPARSSAAGFQRAEVDLHPVGPCAGPCIGSGVPSGGGEIGTLFVATMNNYLNAMLPVMRELLARGRRVSVLLPEAGLTRWPAAASIPPGVRVITAESMVNTEVADLLGREMQRGRERWSVESARILARARVDEAPLGRFIARDIEQMVVHTLPHIAAYTRIARRLGGLGVERVVVARLRRSFELSIARELAAMGAGTTMIVPGEISGAPERRFDDGVFRGVDQIAVWGPLQARAILAKREGARPDAIAVTGNPAWDGLAAGAAPGRALGESRAVLRERIGAALGINAGCAWLAVIGREDARSRIRRVLEVAAANPHLCVLVRPHPRERAESYIALPEGLPADRVRLCTNASAGLHELLAAADATIALHSATSIESLILGTPVITVALGERAAMDRLAPLEDYGLPLASDEGTLAVNLSRLSEAPNQFRTSLHEAMDRALRDIVMNHAGGHAAEEIADLLRPARKAAAA